MKWKEAMKTNAKTKETKRTKKKQQLEKQSETAYRIDYVFYLVFDATPSPHNDSNEFH